MFEPVPFDADRKVPKTHSTGENAVRWKVDEINEYLNSRPRATGEAAQANSNGGAVQA